MARKNYNLLTGNGEPATLSSPKNPSSAAPVRNYVYDIIINNNVNSSIRDAFVAAGSLYSFEPFRADRIAVGKP